MLQQKQQFTVHVRAASYHCTRVYWSTFHRVVRTSVRLISYSGKHCSENCIVRRYKILIAWSAFCCTAGSHGQATRPTAFTG